MSSRIDQLPRSRNNSPARNTDWTLPALPGQQSRCSLKLARTYEDGRNCMLYTRLCIATGFLLAAIVFSGTVTADETKVKVHALGDSGSTAAQPAKAVTAANRDFDVPEMSLPSIDQSRLQFTDVGAKIPNYTPGAQWGTQEAPLTLMQAPLPAEESMQAYSLPRDFRLSLWAKESNENWPEPVRASGHLAGLQGKPIAMNWDERGRLWICETLDYPNELNTESGHGRDRIKICEDTDNDGQADKFTVFAENLSIPSTLVCCRGGAIVQDGPVTVYLKDINGDDKADFRQELITGWAMGDTHGGVSNFQYGPDNWIWAMQGYNNSEPVINGEKQMGFRQGFWRFKVRSGAADQTAPAFAIDDSGKPSNARSDVYNENTIRVEALEFIRATNNNTWGLGFSEEGYVFGSTANGCPSVHMPIPNRYYDQVSGWSPKTLERISPNHNFRALDDKIRQVDWHGGYTAAAGSALYTARNYPETWWNRIQMVCEPTGHIVGGFVLEKNGAGYKSSNLFNAVASVDDWSSPIMAEVGPDGNVWIIDWYNYIIQHNPTPNGFRTGKGAAYESDLRDKRFARIYRLIYEETAGVARNPSHTVQLTHATNNELVGALKDTNFFWRRTAQRLLVERNATDQDTLAALMALVDNREVDSIGLNPAAMHAIWTLAGLADSGNLQATAALTTACAQGFTHPSSPVRNAAVSFCSDDQVHAAVGAGLLEDIDPRVQLAALLRIADGTGKASGDTLAAMAGGTADDILLDAWTAAGATQAVDTLVAVIKAEANKPKSNALAARIAVLAEHAARTKPTAADIAKLLQIDASSPLAVSLWEGLAKGWPRDLTLDLPLDAQQVFRERFLADEVPVANKAAVLAVADKWSVADMDARVASIQSDLFTTALDSSQKKEERLAAFDQAIRLAPSSERITQAIDALFTPQLPPEIGTQALSLLQTARVDGLAEHLLELRGGLGPRLGSSILTLLLARADWTEILLNAISDGRVQFTDMQLDQRQAILNHPNRELALRAKELMELKGAAVASDRQTLLDQWMPVTNLPGNVQNGIAVYKKNCAQCHKHGEVGVAIGPNLTGMAVHPKAEILMNVLDPSRSVENNFRVYQILTAGGAVISGMLAGESANSMRLIDTQGKEQQVLREDIEQMTASSKSLMPEGFESSITKQEMADLLSFLNQRGKFIPLLLSNAATLSGPVGLPSFRGGENDKLEFDSYGAIEIEGVPFEIQDPSEGRVPNIIALQTARGRRPASFPEATKLACSGRVSAIHILGGVASFGFPLSRNESVSLIVRCKYAEGSTVEHELINGKHIANYRERVDVPESAFALSARGKQVRYIKIAIDDKLELNSIEFAKGEDFSTPLVFAVTVESAENANH